MNQNRYIDAHTPPFVDPVTLIKEPHINLADLRKKHSLIQLGEGQYMALRAEHERHHSLNLDRVGQNSAAARLRTQKSAFEGSYSHELGC